MQLHHFCKAHTHVVTYDSVKFEAFISWAAIASSSNTEQREPSVPAGSTGLRSDQRHPFSAAQVVTVHPVQNGPGGDPVLGSGVPVLPHVKYHGNNQNVTLSAVR